MLTELFIIEDIQTQFTAFARTILGIQGDLMTKHPLFDFIRFSLSTRKLTKDVPHSLSLHCCFWPIIVSTFHDASSRPSMQAVSIVCGS